jgi:hypothetical protein
MPVQPGGHRRDRGDTATLMTGVNSAVVPARFAYSARALAVSAGNGMAQSCRLRRGGTSGYVEALAYLLIASFAVALRRAWSLAQGRHLPAEQQTQPSD